MRTKRPPTIKLIRHTGEAGVKHDWVCIGSNGRKMASSLNQRFNNMSDLRENMRKTMQALATELGCNL